ncbi:hypothetical protein N7478_000935 [Penicillium angulare]|uniref:uncharacterized protein n=1 Tax=Penicillium angulare TaxID=116970 RepID=UPI00253FE525|nr:uncharacterized protein N7478_000935 [Penicillium angulare]KAJ5291684.1 hypothetical protein N7478_000935 [Penicillium angulare]
MAVSVFPPPGDSADLTLLNTARLFTRLEHNLLSPGSELRTLRGSEFQRMRVNKNVEYARSLLSQLERSLSNLKINQRGEAQAEIARDKQLLKRMQAILEEETQESDSENDEWEDILSKPLEENVIPEIRQESTPPHSTTSVPASTSTSAPAPVPTFTAPPTSTLRNRHNQSQERRETLNEKSAEQALSSSRLEQEDLTSSLLSLAGQLKASSQSFQSTLENEQSVLDRAVTGMDKTTTTMEAAGKRMGMLRKMSEGKGWWGRMMLYAWIFGLWIVAILIVYVGPKLRF